MTPPNLTRRDLFYGVLIVGIALAALARSRAERDRTEAAERRAKQAVEEYKERERRQSASSTRMQQQYSEFLWAWSKLRDEANALRERLGEPKQLKEPQDYLP
jgi:hypothetical protein